MGIEILSGSTGDPYRIEEQAVMVCNTSGTAFGPVFTSREEAEAFLDWLLPTDPRQLVGGELEATVARFRTGEQR